MHNRKQIITELRTQLETSKQRLRKNKPIPIPECKGIIDKLEVIKTMEEQKSEFYEERPRKEDIEDLIADFNESSEGATKILQEMLSSISDGRIPKQESVYALDESIGGLQQKYSSIYQVVMDQIPEDEVPEFGSPVQAFAKAIKESKTLQYRKILTNAQSTLESFVSVCSLIAVYSTALEPYQIQARNILRQISCGEAIAEEDLNREIAGPAVFLEAIKCKDFDSEESLELLENVLSYYPSRVQNGVAGKKYYLEQRENAEQKKTEEEIKEEPDNTHDTEPISKELESSVPDKLTAGSEGNSEFVKSLRAHDALIQSDEEIGVFTRYISSAENKKISASIFIGDIRKGDEQAEKAIIQQIVKTNSISQRFLNDVIRMPDHIVEYALSYLMNKGYLRKYCIRQERPFYCASPRLIKALTYKDGSKSVGVKQCSVEKWGEPIEDKATSAASRIAYTEIYTDVAIRIRELEIQGYWEEHTIFNDAFISRFFYREEELILGIGAFWKEAEECDEFLKTIRDYLTRFDKIPRLIIAGLNFDYAKAIAESVFEILKDACSFTNAYLYSMKDNKYYLYEDLEEVSWEDIWPGEEEDEKFEGITEPVSNFR